MKHPFDSQHLHSLQKMLTLGLSVVDRKLEKEIENEKDENEIQQNIHLQIPVNNFFLKKKSKIFLGPLPHRSGLSKACKNLWDGRRKTGFGQMD